MDSRRYLHLYKIRRNNIYAAVENHTRKQYNYSAVIAVISRRYVKQ
jgi:hypothetical protein